MNTMVEFHENVLLAEQSANNERSRRRVEERHEERGENTCMVIVGLKKDICEDELESLTDTTDDCSWGSDYLSDGSDIDFLVRSSGTAETPRRSHSSASMLRRKRRKLKFNTIVQIREFKLTIGDHPYCEDALPLSLDWPYFETSKHIRLSRHRGKLYSAGPLLSLESRKQRLIQVSKYERAHIDILLHLHDGNEICYLIENLKETVKQIASSFVSALVCSEA